MFRNISRGIMPFRTFSTASEAPKKFPRGKVLAFLGKPIIPQKYVNIAGLYMICVSIYLYKNIKAKYEERDAVLVQFKAEVASIFEKLSSDIFLESAIQTIRDPHAPSLALALSTASTTSTSTSVSPSEPVPEIISDSTTTTTTTPSSRTWGQFFGFSSASTSPSSTITTTLSPSSSGSSSIPSSVSEESLKNFHEAMSTLFSSFPPMDQIDFILTRDKHIKKKDTETQ